MLLCHRCNVLLCIAVLSVSTSRASASRPAPYEIAFAGFGPLNSDIFIADADGNNAKPLLADAEFDGNAIFTPDGRGIIFASRRAGSTDIYRAHLDGSALEPLVASPAYDDQPALSPDGRTLAFVSSRSGNADIWLLDLRSRKVRNLTASPDGDFRPSWSPDGRSIAFSSDRTSLKPRVPARDFTVRHSTEIFVIRVNGTGLRQLTSDSAYAGSPTWSLDGKSLTFYSAAIPEVARVTGARRLRGTTQIETIEIASGIRKVVTTGDGEKWSPRWLRDGRLGYVTGGPEGGVAFVGGVAGTRGAFQSPFWSSDGKRMIFNRDVERSWPPYQKWASLDLRFALVRTGIFPSYSPDGKSLISNDQTAGILHNSIIRTNAGGGSPKIIFDDPKRSALAPDVSRDGVRIAFGFGGFFQNQLGRQFADIATIDANGGDLQILTDGTGNFGLPSFSPDSRSVVFRRAGPDNNALEVMDIATRVRRVLIEGKAHYNFPAWSPKGDRIAFTADIDGDYDIWSVRPDGSNLRRLTKAPGNDAHNSWSPDGKWIAFASARGGFKDEAMLHPANPQPYGEIYVMRSDGSDVRELTDEPFEKGTPAWRPLRR